MANMNDKEERKAVRERKIFGSFAQCIGLKVEFHESRRPPEPDILCNVSGTPYFVELVEITDPGLAADVTRSLKTGKITGGAFSQDFPLCRAFDEKAANTYETDDRPLILLAYYDKQYPWNEDGYFDDMVKNRAQEMVGSGKWHSVWIYDTWKKRLLWKHGQDLGTRQTRAV